jgi:C-terminal processing protease CtpA/Prc
VLLLALVGLATAICAGCTSTARLTPAAATEHLQAERFSRVERLVRTRYYAADFGGLDWSAVVERHRFHVLSAPDDLAWYRAVNRMLGELRDAHTRVEQPDGRAPGRRSSTRAPVATWRETPGVEVLADGVVRIRFDRFDVETGRWFARTVAHHADAPGMILDLRHNNGGLVSTAQRMIGMFFARRVPIGIVVERNGRRYVEKSRGGFERRYDGPVVVLIGPGTHSSAEVMAHALQAHRRATVVGSRTAGEVLGARAFRLRDGGQLMLSVTDFLCSDGTRLEGRGVQPDISIAPTDGEEPDAGVDRELVAALEVLAGDRESRVTRSSRLPASP